MDIALLFGGAVVSVIVQILKKYVTTDRYGVLAIVIVLSVLASWGAWYLQRAGLWEAFLQILVGAGAVYGFIVKNIEDIRDEQ